MLFTKTNFLPPPSGLKIIGHNSVAGINHFVAQAESGGQKFKIAINPLSYDSPESLIGKSLDEAIKKASTIDPKAPFFRLDQDFSETKGKVLKAKKFCFGEDIFSELYIEKPNEEYVRIIFSPHRRHRNRGFNLRGRTVHVSPSKLKAVIDGRIKEWDGKNL